MYLPSLHSHHQKTHGPQKEIIKVGDVVQIHNEGSRDNWKLDVVTNLIRSDDGQVRAADIRTAKGKTNRTINKLYPLEVTETKEVVTEKKSDPKPPSDQSNSRQARRAAAAKANQRIRAIAKLHRGDGVWRVGVNLRPGICLEY